METNSVMTWPGVVHAKGSDVNNLCAMFPSVVSSNMLRVYSNSISNMNIVKHALSNECVPVYFSFSPSSASPVSPCVLTYSSSPSLLSLFHAPILLSLLHAPVLLSPSSPPQFAPVAPARSNQKALHISLGFLYRISLHAKQLHFDHPWYTCQSLRLPLPLLISSPPSSNPPQITHVAFLPGLGVGMKLFIINNIYRKYPKVYKIVSKVVQRCKCIFINLRCS